MSALFPVTKFTASAIQPSVQEFNYGGVVGINATWNIFDGFATKGRMQATRARREAAVLALAAARRAVASEVRSAFFDLQQADRVLERETTNVQAADESSRYCQEQFRRRIGNTTRHTASHIRRHSDPHNPTQRNLFAQRGPCTSGARLRKFRGSA